MATQYNVHEAKTQFSKLVDRARDGEEIIIAKAGEPAAKLVPIDKPGKILRTPGALKGKMETPPDSVFFDPLPDDELRAWGML